MAALVNFTWQSLTPAARAAIHILRKDGRYITAAEWAADQMDQRTRRADVEDERNGEDSQRLVAMMQAAKRTIEDGGESPSLWHRIKTRLKTIEWRL